MLFSLMASAALAVGVCDDLNLSRADVEKQLVVNLLPVPEKRSEMERLLKSGKGNRCREVLSDFLVSVKNRKVRPDLVPVKGPLLSLAANGGMAAALDVLEFEISKGRGEELFDALERADINRYRGALRNWLNDTVQRMTLGQNTKAAEQRSFSPLFVERFLKMIAQLQQPPLESDFMALNSVFIMADPGYREIFLPLYGKALKSHSAQWLASFRKEPVQRQFRLFPIFESVGGPEVVGELMRISREDANENVRAMAERSLNRILKDPQSK